MAATLHGVDGVGEGQDALGETLVVLQRNLDGVSVGLALNVQRPKIHPTFVAIQILDERADAALEVEGVLEVDPLIVQHDGQRLVEEGQLPQPMRHDVPVEAELFEDFWIRPEPNICPRGIGLTAGFERRDRRTPAVFLVVLLAVPHHRHQQPLRQGVDDGQPDPVQTSRHLVATSAELAAGVELGHDDLQGGLALVFHDVDRDTTAVVGDRGGPVLVEGYLDPGAEPCQRLIGRVVDDLIDEVMETPVIGRPDVHPGTASDWLQTLQNLDGLGVIGRRRLSLRIQQIAYSNYI